MKVKIVKAGEGQFLIRSIPPGLILEGQVTDKLCASLTESLEYCRANNLSVAETVFPEYASRRQTTANYWAGHKFGSPAKWR